MKEIDNNIDEYDLFLKYSKEIGMDTSMIQAAGGNTSLKQDNIMWVKASGKWLVDAQSDELMVPLSISKIKNALEDNKCIDNDIINCVNFEISPVGLRPSVEAPMHAILDFKFVFHTHDININALAVQKNSKLKFKNLLSGLNWKFIPYVKPGIELCRQVMQLKSKKDNVLILENHGLIVCGQSLEEVKKLSHEVRYRFKKTQGQILDEPTEVIDEEIDLKNTGYKYCRDKFINTLAFQKPWIDKLSQGVLLPDFLVFLGPKITIINPKDEGFLDKLKKLSQTPLPSYSCIILAEHGVLIRDDALKGTLEIIRCVRDLLCLIPDSASLKYLSEDEIKDLLNWEAEHYRQQQNISDE
ncbi:class II aldolase/adducin family protein [Alphaproteobacteria bacterium]|nr:class II aldolase/adducin family protein [Alphaproteobacteria bacterium]